MLPDLLGFRLFHIDLSLDLGRFDRSGNDSADNDECKTQSDKNNRIQRRYNTKQDQHTAYQIKNFRHAEQLPEQHGTKICIFRTFGDQNTGRE